MQYPESEKSGLIQTPESLHVLTEQASLSPRVGCAASSMNHALAPEQSSTPTIEYEYNGDFPGLAPALAAGFSAKEVHYNEGLFPSMYAANGPWQTNRSITSQLADSPTSWDFNTSPISRPARLGPCTVHPIPSGAKPAIAETQPVQTLTCALQGWRDGLNDLQTCLDGHSAAPVSLSAFAMPNPPIHCHAESVSYPKQHISASESSSPDSVFLTPTNSFNCSLRSSKSLPDQMASISCSSRSPSSGRSDGSEFQWDTIDHCATLYSEEHEVIPSIHAYVDKSSFSDDQHEWTLYRRNYFHTGVSFTLSPYIQDEPLQVLQHDGVPQAVRGFWMSLVGAVDDSKGKVVEMIQFTPKRDNGPTFPVVRSKMQPKDLNQASNGFHGTHPPPYDGTTRGGKPWWASLGKGLQDFPMEPAEPRIPYIDKRWERLQFKRATANNGRRRATQQYFVLIADLYAEVTTRDMKRDFVKVVSLSSENIVVRGRSPSHYADTVHRSGNDGNRGGFGGKGRGKRTIGENPLTLCSSVSSSSDVAVPHGSYGHSRTHYTTTPSHLDQFSGHGIGQFPPITLEVPLNGPHLHYESGIATQYVDYNALSRTRSPPDLQSNSMQDDYYRHGAQDTMAQNFNPHNLNGMGNQLSLPRMEHYANGSGIGRSQYESTEYLPAPFSISRPPSVEAGTSPWQPASQNPFLGNHNFQTRREDPGF